MRGGLSMPKQKSMWLLEIARHFGMSVSQLAEYMGYSRQALYQAASDENHLDRRRLSVALCKLEMKNEKMYQAEKALAEENFKKRQQLIDSLADRLSV